MDKTGIPRIVESAMMRSRTPRRQPALGFSLLEILAASAVLMLVLVIVFVMVGNVSTLWQRQRGQSAAFEGASAAYEALTRSLAQATLATYWGYATNASGQATAFRRESDLHFQMGRTAELLGLQANRHPGMAVFFQAPTGRTTDRDLKRLPSLLNGLGYFTVFGEDPDVPDFLRAVLPVERRFRLVEWQEPVEDLEVYADAAGGDWFTSRVLFGGNLRNTAVLADNIVGLILLAEYPAPGGGTERSYVYDSRDESALARRHQLPPRIHVVMMAISEASAERLAEKYGAEPPPLAPDEGAEGLFQDPGQFEEDIGEWEYAIQKVTPRVEYLLFNSTVHLKNAKWSL